jgi:hypothetical protein
MEPIMAINPGAINPGAFNWQALAGLASGNSVGEQFANVNNIMAAQQPLIQQKATENKTLAYLNQYHPEIAAQVQAGMPMQNALQMVAQAQQPRTAEFKQLDDGTYGSWDGSKFTKLGTAQKPADLPAIADEYNWIKQQGFTGTPQEYQVWKANLNKQKGMVIESTPDGGFRMVQGDVDPNQMPKLTEAEGKNAGFLKRALSAEKELSALEAEGTSMWNKAAGTLPLGAGNYVVSEGAQKFNQAKRNFINAVLRRESGAVISPEEFENANQQYFPQPGDGDEVIAQKRKNREDAIAGFEIGSGPAAKRVQQMDGAQQPDTGVVPYTDFFK